MYDGYEAVLFFNASMNKWVMLVEANGWVEEHVLFFEDRGDYDHGAGITTYITGKDVALDYARGTSIRVQVVG
jgi:hypothetical protein